MPLFPSYIYTYIYTYRRKPSLYQTYRSSLSEKRGTAPTFPHKSINPSNPPETITSPTPRGLNSVQARCQRNVLPPPSQLPLFLRKPNFHLKKEKKRGGEKKKKQKAPLLVGVSGFVSQPCATTTCCTNAHQPERPTNREKE